MEILVNGSRVDAWDPFCRDEQATVALPEHDLHVASETGIGIVHVRPYVLPDKSEFSDSAAWQRASGLLKWNRQQGLYIYRANRLIQWGGWSRLRTIDEHSKLARVAVDFFPSLDAAFGINISKAIVKLPVDLHGELEPIVNQVVRIADKRYRKGEKGPHTRPPAPTPTPAPPPHPPAAPWGGTQPRNDPGAASRPDGPSQPDRNERQPPSPGQPTRRAIEEAARDAGEEVALERIITSLRRTAPGVARDLGW